MKLREWIRAGIPAWTLTVGLLFLVAPAAAITIDAGPVYVPPGAGTETFSGDAATAGGATIAETGYDLSQTVNLYFGVRADLFQNGYSMDGAAITGSEIFRYASRTANTITYTGQTIMVTTFQGTHVIPTRMTWTFTGTGTTVEDATTQALNDPANGDVAALWHVQSGSFSANVLIEAQVPPFDPNAGNYEPANDLFNRIQTLNSTGSSFDWGFYYETGPVPPFTYTTSSGTCCFFSCPQGDGDTLAGAACPITLTARDANNNPVTTLTAADFELDGCPVPGAIADCIGGTPSFAQGPPGTYTFGGAFAAGGFGFLNLKVLGAFVPAACLPITTVSADISANGIVNLADVGTFAIDLTGAYNPRSDFDCDGVINLVDVGTLAVHLGHACAAGVDPVDKAPPRVAGGAPEIYLSFDASARQITPPREIVAGEPFVFHVLAEGAERLTAWEARVIVPREIDVVARRLPAQGQLNMGSGDDWVVGLGTAAGGVERPLVLATYEAVVREAPTPGQEIGLGASSLNSARSGLPAWADESTAVPDSPVGAVRSFAYDGAGLTLSGGVARAETVGRSAILGSTPNPFNPSTLLRFRVGVAGPVQVVVFDVAGRQVRGFPLPEMEPGDHELRWDGRDDTGSSVASGTYMVQLQAVDRTDSWRVVLLK